MFNNAAIHMSMYINGMMATRARTRLCVDSHYTRRRRRRRALVVVLATLRARSIECCVRGLGGTEQRRKFSK